MSLKIDLQKALESVEQRQQAKLPPARDRALQALRDVLDLDLSMLELLSFCTALAEKHSYVADSLAHIEVSEALGVRKPKPRGKGTGNKRSAATAQAIATIQSVVGTASEPLSKQQVMDASKLDKTAFNTAWATVRSTLKASGTGPMTRYARS